MTAAESRDSSDSLRLDVDSTRHVKNLTPSYEFMVVRETKSGAEGIIGMTLDNMLSQMKHEAAEEVFEEIKSVLEVLIRRI